MENNKRIVKYWKSTFLDWYRVEEKINDKWKIIYDCPHYEDALFIVETGIYYDDIIEYSSDKYRIVRFFDSTKLSYCYRVEKFCRRWWGKMGWKKVYEGPKGFCYNFIKPLYKEESVVWPNNE